jgi:Domain of unknown function (DUF4389)
VRLTEDLDLRRPRLTVLLRPLLLVPALLVAAAAVVVAAAALPLAFAAALTAGRVPDPLHRTLALALTYLLQVDGWATLVTGRCPWPHAPGRHPIRLFTERRPQRRWTVLLRLPLAVPALVLASVFGVVRWSAGVAAWFVALALGRTTSGLRELGGFCLRYTAEALAYVLLLTPAYPRLATERPPTGAPR